MSHPPRKRLAEQLAKMRPEVAEPAQLIASGAVRVDGRIVTNPASLVRPDASIVVRKAAPLRGEAKLQAALAAFDVSVAGRVTLDVGAAAGGFTRVLLEAGAKRVYAVDAGHGQLMGSLRQDPRVVNLESTNLGELNRRLVPDVVAAITFDLSYLSVAAAVGQLKALAIAPDAMLIALVKPMFELHLDRAPLDRTSLDAALARAVAGVEVQGWRVVGHMDSPIAGARGALELFIHARRQKESVHAEG